MTNYTNRYGDQYKFELMPNGNIMWTGKFEWCRWGVPNVYDKAYAKYQEDGGTESLLIFTKMVHEWDDIDMVDPSGGPYIARGNNMEKYFGKEFTGKIVHSFKRHEEGYEIVCYGTTE